MDTKDLHQFAYLQCIIEAVDRVAQEDVTVASKMQRVLKDSTPLTMLAKLLQKDALPEFAQDGHEHLCTYALNTSRQQLCFALISLLLNSSFIVEDTHTRLPPAILQKLVAKQTNISISLAKSRQSRRPSICNNSLQSVEPHFPLVLPDNGFNPDVPTSCPPSYRWREHLFSTVQTTASEHAHRTIHAVEAICADFESRCANVEGPLRKEQQRRSEAEDQMRRLQERLDSLSTEATDRELHLDGLEVEKTDLQTRLDDTIQQNTLLVSENDGLRQRVEDATENASRTVENARAEKEAIEFRLKTQVVTAEGLEERLKLDVENLKTKNDELEELLEGMRKETEASDGRVRELVERLEEIEKEKEEYTVQVGRKEEYLARKDEENEELNTALDAAQVVIRDMRVEFEDAKSINAESIKQLNGEIEKASYQDDVVLINIFSKNCRRTIC